jgi:hypothetical protein
VWVSKIFMKKCKKCGAVIEGKRRLYCSDKCERVKDPEGTLYKQVNGEIVDKILPEKDGILNTRMNAILDNQANMNNGLIYKHEGWEIDFESVYVSDDDCVSFFPYGGDSYDFSLENCKKFIRSAVSSAFAKGKAEGIEEIDNAYKKGYVDGVLAGKKEQKQLNKINK